MPCSHPERRKVGNVTDGLRPDTAISQPENRPVSPVM